MNDLTVACGCGRQMTLDSRRGRGAYRCGCGARIMITAASKQPQARCLGRGRSGVLCPTRPTSGSTRLGVPLCADHLEEYEHYLSVVDDGERWAQLMKEAWEDSRIAMEKQLASHSPWQESYDAARRRAYSTQSVVYYIRVGDSIKIGVTTNMKARMSSLMPDEILATEPGDASLEKNRHAQFAHLRIRGERFRPDPELVEHIVQVRHAHGEPQMTGYLYVDGENTRRV